MTERRSNRRLVARACVAGLLVALVPAGRSAMAAKPASVGAIACSSQPNVVADLNGDGVKDLVVGAPGDGLEKTEIDGSVTSSKPEAGSINIIYGHKPTNSDTAAGLQPMNGPTGAPLFISQDTPGVVDDGHSGDLFGSALAVGDFNGDSRPDLAVGVPGEDSQAGAVHIFYGGDAATPGLRVGTPGSSTYNQVVKIGSRLRGNVVGAGRHAGDLMGWALATGDFDNNGFADLAIGIPGYQIRTVPDAGAVLILYGSSSGLTAPLLSTSSAGGRGLYQSGTGDAGAERGDYFGASLVAGDFNASTPPDKPVADDLAVGAPGEDVGKAADAGGVNVFYGAQGGGVMVTESSPFMPAGSPATSDRFGCALAAGNLDNDTANDTDLAIGIPGKDISGAADAGAVVTLYNSGGLRTASPPRDCSTPVQPAAATTGVVVHHSSVTSSSSNSSDCWTDPQLWTENAGGIPGVAKAGDHFGGSLFSADVNSDGPADLIVGVPNENLYGDGGAGSIRVIFGFDKFGITDRNGLAFAQRPSDPCTSDDAENAGFCASPPEYTEIGMTIEEGDHFGQTLAVGDFDGDGSPDIAVGVPGESIGDVVNYAFEEMVGEGSDAGGLPLSIDDNPGAGALQVIYGSVTTDAKTKKTTVNVAGGTPDVLYRDPDGIRSALIDGSGSAPMGQTNGQGIGDTLFDDGGGTDGASGEGGVIGNPGLVSADGGPTTSSTTAGDHLAAAFG